MMCPVCGERGYERQCKEHRAGVCACCHMCTKTAMSPFVTCQHYSPAKTEPKKGHRL